MCFEKRLPTSIPFFKSTRVYFIVNKTDLQPVSRPLEQVHYFRGVWVGSNSLWCLSFAERQTNRQIDRNGGTSGTVNGG